MKGELDIVKKAAEDYKKMAEGLRVPFAHLQDLARRMEDSLKPLQAASKVIADQHLAITRAFKMFDTFLPKIKEFQDFAKRIQEAWERDKEAIRKSGWWFTPSFMDLPSPSIGDAARKYTMGDKRAVTNFFISTYHRDNFQYLKKTVLEWKKNPYFKPWDKHLNHALKAHMAGEYTLSVPALLLAAEGIGKKYCKVKGESFLRSSGNDKISKALKRSGVDNIDVQKDLEMLEIDVFFTAMDSRVYGDTKFLKRTRGFRHLLNRHAVLHGESPHYGTRKNSLQCFMLLDVMSLLK